MAASLKTVEDLTCADLDDVVHDAAQALATNANNDGQSGQLDFLTTVCGWTEQDILATINGVERNDEN